MVQHYYTFMLGVTEQSGVAPDKFTLIERWTETQLYALEKHFRHSSFLFGEIATLGDYSLMGPFFGQLCWDPCPAEELIKPRPHLRAWVERMSIPGPRVGDLLPDDELPAAPQPLLRSMCSELIPYLESSAQWLRIQSPLSARDCRYVRFGPMVEVPFGDGSLQRMTIT